ncbi:dTDP-4-dehydrorhamnose 3,5-epimerase family protein [Luteibacter sp. 9133]|uniref:dTDP-4-dehydrorhamnose 3,5-epimerase family protein n=1 Tax=Luteibacter sp. 9133 TaxID=1500891 RepID=UPI0005BA9EC4|nr:dTDP-4-dehydrorhamnose 3,5-epimerase family protein [Luteibacter sp. 9133]
MSQRLVSVGEPLASLRVFERVPAGDGRGFLERLYEHGGGCDFPGFGNVAQVNRTVTTRRGTVRGMHFQRPPFAESKLVHCLRGSVLDIAVDLRFGSPTFLQWHGEVLSPGNHRCMWIPEGFAHGFQTLEDDCELLYVHSQPYRAEHEGGVHPCDPQVAIQWPMEIAAISERDASHSFIDNSFVGVQV